MPTSAYADVSVSAKPVTTPTAHTLGLGLGLGLELGLWQGLGLGLELWLGGRKYADVSVTSAYMLSQLNL